MAAIAASIRIWAAIAPPKMDAHIIRFFRLIVFITQASQRLAPYSFPLDKTGYHQGGLVKETLLSCHPVYSIFSNKSG